MRLLKENTGVQLLSDGNAEVKSLVFEMSYGLTMEKAMSAPKIFQVKKKLGPENLIKLLAVIIKSFCDSVKATKTMDVVDVFECAELLCETYTHDSVKDIVMALKQAKMRGMNFYNVVNTPVIFEIITEYMDKKSTFIEKNILDQKSRHTGGTRTELYTLAINAEKSIQRQEEMYGMKELKLIQAEKKEVQNLQKLIDKTLDSKI